MVSGRSRANANCEQIARDQILYLLSFVMNA